MAAPELSEIKDSAKNAAKEALDSGVISYQHHGRSQTHIDPLRALEIAREAEALERNDTYGTVTLADMRSAI